MVDLRVVGQSKLTTAGATGFADIGPRRLPNRMLINVDHWFRSSVMRAVIRKQGFVLLMLIIPVAVTAQWSKPVAPTNG